MIVNTHRTALLGTLALVAVLVAGCHILDVTNPDVVLPGSLNGPAALPTIRAGAIGDFAIAYSGSGAQGSGGTVEGQILLSGMLADELINTETFPDRILADARQPQIESATLQTVFRNLHRARVSAEAAAQKFRLFADTMVDAGLSEMLSLSGFTYVFFAENYCSGVPFSSVNADGSFSYGGPLTRQQTLDTAISRFNQALTAATVLDTSGSTATIRAPKVALRLNRIRLASVGNGRALLDEGQFDAADASVANVTTGFNYLILHDLNTTRQNNGVFNGMFNFKRYGVPDSSEGLVGLPWRTVPDPRTPVFRRILNTSTGPKPETGFDGVTPQYNQNRYMDQKASVTLATGAEARLISAEAALQRGDTAGMLVLLNTLRASPPTYFLNAGAPIAPGTLSPLPGPVGPAAAVDLLFTERARWLWLTSHRLGDLRRLERQYGRPDNQVFPTGPYFKSGLQYGTAVNYPVPIDELNNPNFQQCLDRLP